MGVVTYIGPETPAQVSLSTGPQVVVRGVNYTFPDSDCAALLAQQPLLWLAGDQHTQTLIPPDFSTVRYVYADASQFPQNQYTMANASAGAFTYQLVDVTTVAGGIFTIKNAGNQNNVTLITSFNQQLDSSGGATSLALVPGQSVSLLADATGVNQGGVGYRQVANTVVMVPPSQQTTSLGSVGGSCAVAQVAGAFQSVTMTLATDSVCKITPASGGTTRLYVGQDAVGGHTLSLGDTTASVTAVPVNTAASACSVLVLSSPDGSLLYVENS